MDTLRKKDMAKYQKDSEEPPGPPRVRYEHRGQQRKTYYVSCTGQGQTHLLRGRAPNRSQSKTQYMPYMKGTSACDKEER